MNYFLGRLLKFLPATVFLTALAGCQNATVSANSATELKPDPVVAPAGSVLRVRLDQALDTRRSRPGDRFTGVLDWPLVADGKEVLPKGTIVEGHVLTAHESGRLRGRAVLSLTLDSCTFGGKLLPVSTNIVSRSSRAHKKRNWSFIGGTSGGGALIGGLAAGPAGALIGAGSGAAAGVTAAAITGKKDVSVPAESLLSFQLTSSLVAE